MEPPAKRARGEECVLEQLSDAALAVALAGLDVNDAWRLRGVSRRLKRIVEEKEWARVRMEAARPARLKKLAALLRDGSMKLDAGARLELALGHADDEKELRRAAASVLGAAAPFGIAGAALEAPMPLESTFQAALDALAPAAASLRSLSVLDTRPAASARPWEPDGTYLKARLSRFGALEELRLPHARLSERGAESLAAACPKLRRASLAFVKAAAAGPLGRLSGLEELEATLGDDAGPALEPLASGPAASSLRALRLRGPPEGPQALDGRALQAIGRLSALETLELSGLWTVSRGVSPVDLASIGVPPKLASLCLHLGFADPPQISALASAIRTAPALQSLDLLLLPGFGSQEDVQAALREVASARPAALRRLALHSCPPLSPNLAQAIAACRHLSALELEARLASEEGLEGYAALASLPAARVRVSVACLGGGPLRAAARGRLTTLLPRALVLVP
eukprot:tig00021522_g22114.t1